MMTDIEIAQACNRKPITEIAATAYRILKEEWKEGKAIRMLTVGAAGLCRKSEAAQQISFFGEAIDSMFFAVAENIYLFFLPALLLVGLRVYLGHLVHATPGGRTFLLIMFFAILCCSFSSAVAILGLLGAWNAISGAIARAARNRMEEDDGKKENRQRLPDFTERKDQER